MVNPRIQSFRDRIAKHLAAGKHAVEQLRGSSRELPDLGTPKILRRLGKTEFSRVYAVDLSAHGINEPAAVKETYLPMQETENTDYNVQLAVRGAWLSNDTALAKAGMAPVLGTGVYASDRYDDTLVHGTYMARFDSTLDAHLNAQLLQGVETWTKSFRHLMPTIANQFAQVQELGYLLQDVVKPDNIMLDAHGAPHWIDPETLFFSPQVSEHLGEHRDLLNGGMRPYTPMFAPDDVLYNDGFGDDPKQDAQAFGIMLAHLGFELHYDILDGNVADTNTNLVYDREQFLKNDYRSYAARNGIVGIDEIAKRAIRGDYEGMQALARDLSDVCEK